MKMIDRNGRIFGKISVIDLVVAAVVVVLAAALYFKSNQVHTGGTVDQNYPSGGRAMGYITEVEVERDPGT